jgi:predicted HicB family RNase H-like nuclease
MSEKYTEIELDIPNDVLLALAVMAHEQQITLNELCCKAIKEEIERKEKEEYTN